MGSTSDLGVMQEAIDVVKEFGVPYEVTVVSAHRTPERMGDYARTAAGRGLKVIIAGAGGAAHLPGMVASHSSLPVIGVPIRSRNSIEGWDSLLSIVQMPSGIPVATVAIDGGRNAGLMALRILATSDEALMKKLDVFKQALRQKVEQGIKDMKARFPNTYDETDPD